VKFVFLRKALCSLKRSMVAALIAAVAAGGLWGPGVESVRAYVLQGPHILDLMARQLSGAKSLRVTQRVTLEESSMDTKQVVLDETLRFIFPERFRSDVKYDDNQRIMVDSKGQRLTVVDGEITDEPEGWFDRYKDLLLYNTPELLHKTLSKDGVDVETTSLGRFGDKVVYVIGARYPDESVSQLWVDMDRFLPVRWLTVHPVSTTPGEQDRWEFVYSGWQKVDGMFYPFRIETIHNGQIVRSVRVTRAEANVAIDTASLDVEQMRSKYPVKAVTVPSEEDRAVPGVEGVQRAIDDFKRKFEP